LILIHLWAFLRSRKRRS